SAQAGAAVAPGAASPGDLITAEHKAIAGVDAKALAALLAPGAFGFGVDAAEAAEGQAGVVAQIVHDLGDPPPGGFTVTAKPPVVGQDSGHAWIAEELELGGADREPRHLAISSLAAQIDNQWRFVAVHWAAPVADATAERMAILQTLPAPQPIADRHDGDASLDRAVRDAFASREAFADASSERPDAFNYGSGGERARGASIKKVFGKLRASIRLHDGARVASDSAWQPSAPGARFGWAAVNVDFTSRTRAATEVTQTFRVLAILIKDGGSWKILQSHWSNGGPIH
ncbi:MAG TPA: nuclear transport factor 2 family protein, partial [Kofleriaceae bacterium]